MASDYFTKPQIAQRLDRIADQSISLNREIVNLYRFLDDDGRAQIATLRCLDFDFVELARAVRFVADLLMTEIENSKDGQVG
jgi:hypothetical protein